MNSDVTRMTKIEVVPYDASWPQQCADEAEQMRRALGDNLLAVHHVGSTSVPGLTAKPKIDILAVVQSPEKAVEPLASIGYEYRGEYNIPLHYGFSKRRGAQVNLHVYQEGHPEIELNLAFRDYLRQNSHAREEYAALKARLLEDPSSFVKEDSIFSGYNLGKDAFIRKVLELANFERLRLLHCTHRLEWDTAKALRQHHFFDKVPISDPYTWTFNHPAHRHFVLCRGVAIIGYAHIQLWPNSRAAIRIIVVDTPHRNRGYGKQFLQWIELWLQRQEVKAIHTEASPDAVRFYQLAGYTSLPFDDPDGYETDPRDTPMGKLL